MAGSLQGLKVLDCTHVLAGAWCSLILADLGADVVKVEPLAGEATRGRPDSPFRPFDFVNRNKRAIAVDITSEAGAQIIQRLSSNADVLVENYRPGVLDRAGLGYAALRAANPRLIYASVSGFGQSGPYRDRGGLDLIAQAMSGIMSFTGEPGAQRPVSAGVPLADVTAGIYAAVGVLAALNHRHLTGEGQHVEASLLESAMAHTVWEAGAALTTGQVARPNGSRHRLTAPYEALKTQDGFLVVGVNNQRLWGRLCEVLSEPQLEHDPAFATPQARLANRDALQARLEAILARDTTEAWVARISGRGVPCGPVNRIDEALADPHLAARGYLTEIAGRRFPRTPLGFSETPVSVTRGPPRVGEHTREVLAEAGLEPAMIEDLAHKGAIGMAEAQA
ncbi:MAG TPA: CoA transferase [Caulobacteraceae bacterium]|jgi:crotonobetainyl-CoA:carnitine CoA-transferase CaiB-like acyl-CoA transferase|nr:CoA transferase [Caulobacteraceae bacterium]